MGDSPAGASAEARRRGWRLMGEELRTQRMRLVLAAVAGLTWTAAKVSVPLLAV